MRRAMGGNKRSSWITFHRRLFLVRRLVRGPATAETLIADARAFFDDPEIYPPDARAALRHDFQALRNEFECVIRRREEGYYALEDFGRLALLDLSDNDMEALAFLIANFSEGGLPNAAQVDALLDRIVALLPHDRRIRFQRPARDVRLDYPASTSPSADHTLRLIKRALRRQQITFGYRSSYAPGGTVAQHRVAPYDLLFRDGHIYLDAYCYDCGVAEYGRTYVLYRLDRIVDESLRLLPTVLVPIQPTRPVYRLRYVLGPAVACQRDVALWGNHSEVIFLNDGSAQITAETADLWQARQILLRYREHCRVLEPPQLIEMIQDSLARMQQVYMPAASEDIDP
jgi:predicted DNA-binding transcriptional regulator YafY